MPICLMTGLRLYINRSEGETICGRRNWSILQSPQDWSEGDQSDDRLDDDSDDGDDKSFSNSFVAS